MGDQEKGSVPDGAKVSGLHGVPPTEAEQYWDLQPIIPEESMSGIKRDQANRDDGNEV